MSRIGIGFIVVLALLTVGCGYGSNYMNAGQPAITSLLPNTINAGDPTFTLNVNGSGFGMDSVVFWNGTARPSRYSSATKVQAQISDLDIANAEMAQVEVHTGGKKSNVINFTVQ
jgi:hypothetical protein